MCDNPNATKLDVLDRMRQMITASGWAVQGVEGDRLHPPWAYTVGLTPEGAPELVISGKPLDECARVLNDTAAHALHAEPPVPGERIPLVGGPLVEIVGVPHPDAHLETAVALYGAQVRALQLVWADDRGHWPWDAGFRGRQRLFGPRVSR